MSYEAILRTALSLGQHSSGVCVLGGATIAVLIMQYLYLLEGVGRDSVMPTQVSDVRYGMEDNFKKAKADSQYDIGEFRCTCHDSAAVLRLQLAAF